MDMDADIVVVGGGLAGLTAALAAGQAGLRVTVIDRLGETVRKNARFDGRAYALALASQKMLAAIGLWSDVAGNAQPMMEVKASDGRAGEGPAPFVLAFDQAELEDGPLGYMVEDRHLRRSLLAHVAAHPRITHLSGVEVQGQEVGPHGVTVRLAQGQSLRCALLVGADGRESATAKRAGISRMRWSYGQTARVCAVAHDTQHHGIAHQFFMPSGPLAILPLTGQRSSIVWTERTQDAAYLSALSDAAFLAHLRPRFGNFLGEISLAGDRYSYPLSLSLAKSLIAERLALVGDAAHGLHPIAGQGLNAGLRDVAALVEVLTEAKRRGEPLGIAPVLERYQRWRGFDTASLALATDGFNRLFSNDNPLLRGARNLGMGVVQGIPSLRRAFMREAAGLTGDVPKLMQGQPL